jgi:hypothetical protein
MRMVMMGRARVVNPWRWGRLSPEFFDCDSYVLSLWRLRIIIALQVRNG